MSFRGKDEPSLNGAAITVFTVDDKENAKSIIVTFGKCQYTPHPNAPVPGTGNVWYRMADFSGSAYDLPEVTRRMSEVYSRILEGKTNIKSNN